MIQAKLTRPTETPKAQPKVERSEVSSSHKAKLKEARTSKEAKETGEKANDFAKELEESLNTEATAMKGAEVNQVQVPQLPSMMLQTEESIETSSPKMFDPELTKDVEKLIAPKTSDKAVPLNDAQVLEIANAEVDGEIASELKVQLDQTILKSPQVSQANGRAPAIDQAKAEIDPQLLHNEDFVAQKNAAAKKSVSNAYGMKLQPAQQKLAAEAGLVASQVVKEASATENNPVNSQQFILGLQSEQKNIHNNETQGAPKIFDMSHVKNANATQIMNQITDYVVQAKAAKETTVNMRVNHEDLGMIDITVSKLGGNQDAIAISIGTHSVDGKNFFQQNSKELFSHLSTAGLNVSDMKLETPTNTAKNDFDFGSQSGKNQQGTEKQFGSEQNQRRQDSERRQDLWKLLNKEAA
jgi:hypothetical protein